MKEKIVSNIFYSILEKGGLIAASFFSSLLLIRFLPREQYGVIGVVAGYYTFVQFFNLALENILLREHSNYREKLPTAIYSFSVINVLKSVLFFILALILSCFLPGLYGNETFVYALFSSSLVLMIDSLISPFVILASARFEQKLVTKINLWRSLMGLILLLGLYFNPSLKFVLIKDVIVFALTLFFWGQASKKLLGYSIFQLSFKKNFDLSLLKEAFWGYSLWVHLVGVVTNFMYKADAFFLSFYVSLNAVGDYTIALTSANVANIIPSILGYQNSVALSHLKKKEERERITLTFLRLNFYISFFSMLVFLLLGHLYLRIMTGQWNQDHIYFYLCFIVAGLLIAKTIVSPLVAYINICGDVKSLFWRVNIPMLLVSVLSYWLSSKYIGPYGVAITNLSNALIWCFLVIWELRRYQFSYNGLLSWREDINNLLGILKWKK